MKYFFLHVVLELRDDTVSRFIWISGVSTYLKIYVFRSVEEYLADVITLTLTQVFSGRHDK
jgi:hypothetical protein